ncbi:Golgi vesicular membrane trafficking protein, putative [Trypanosoma equiperdum]|uniref:Golgi vesicular membrane trafficking protein, putative n=4 Tax=Trypanozoon TaxID=39700 RepID=Q57WA8_TRYB2|nr:Golgi vesicular membrane trafficking protein,putative [Trypanosoma brucei gambiense DAL972]XP_843964.1 Golgi vesicular membrane trafficking protein, putative [Trypanosoma brucei brucei TREU927]AAX70090.1 Golgi vesicular membrane trafficking protein, putative [Trypanosoma brucei]RHW73400.1 Golgi vesicular membrane trafficking protein [Trypanosoma brucei equiperdum]SCU66072.1 Golgi vesicular membrane trafficking protein, putative [Trypanosoma equiperdum]AAZ10405.1 Golgi vesicular membrane tra|eukprot:XP_011772351.1 Golgi vesicular membrane trafficking protein,putative [Trypanosoma brucei gambiense DAL972]
MQPQSSLFRARAQAHGEARPNGTGALTENAVAENDQIMSALLSDVRAVKKNFTSMGVEVRRQNSFLDSLQDTFGRTRARLNRTMRYLNLPELTSAKHMWVLFVFVFVVLVLIYIMLKSR